MGYYLCFHNQVTSDHDKPGDITVTTTLQCLESCTLHIHRKTPNLYKSRATMGIIKLSYKNIYKRTL